MELGPCRPSGLLSTSVPCKLEACFGGRGTFGTRSLVVMLPGAGTTLRARGSHVPGGGLLTHPCMVGPTCTSGALKTEQTGCQMPAVQSGASPGAAPGQRIRGPGGQCAFLGSTGGRASSSWVPWWWKGGLHVRIFLHLCFAGVVLHQGERALSGPGCRKEASRERAVLPL